MNILGIVIGGVGMGESESKLLEVINVIRLHVGPHVPIFIQGIQSISLVSHNR